MLMVRLAASLRRALLNDVRIGQPAAGFPLIFLTAAIANAEHLNRYFRTHTLAFDANSRSPRRQQCLQPP
jgi:hypothetical protein